MADNILSIDLDEIEKKLPPVEHNIFTSEVSRHDLMSVPIKAEHTHTEVRLKGEVILFTENKPLNGQSAWLGGFRVFPRPSIVDRLKGTEFESKFNYMTGDK